MSTPWLGRSARAMRLPCSSPPPAPWLAFEWPLGTEPTAVCPIHGGTGEPAVLLQRDSDIVTEQRAANGEPSAEQPLPARAQTPQQQRARRERGIRRLLHAIFGQ